MKALFIRQPGEAIVDTTPEPTSAGNHLLLRVRLVGLCGSDLNSFRGKNPLVSFPRIPGHEVAATIVEGSNRNPELASGVNVTMSPYTSCGQCASCRRGRPNACQFNQTLGVQRDGAMTEFIIMPEEKLYPSKLSLKELCMVEPLSVGFHAAARGRVTKDDIVPSLGLVASASESLPRATSGAHAPLPSILTTASLPWRARPGPPRRSIQEATRFASSCASSPMGLAPM